MVLLGRSVHPTTLFPGLMLWYLSGGGGEYSDILVLYLGAGYFGGSKTLNFNTF